MRQSKYFTSSEMAQLRAAYITKESLTVNAGGRITQYEPNLPASGMTMFGENGFLLGPEAFSSETELTKTFLHELHRLSTSQIGGSDVYQSAVTAETQDAFEFAERAFKEFFR